MFSWDDNSEQIFVKDAFRDWERANSICWLTSPLQLNWLHLICFQVSGPGRLARWLGLNTLLFQCITSTLWQQRYRRWRLWRRSWRSSGTWRGLITCVRKEMACCLAPMRRWKRWFYRTPGWEMEYHQVCLPHQIFQSKYFYKVFIFLCMTVSICLQVLERSCLSLTWKG